MDTFGKRLAKLRKDTNMTQDDLSNQLHVSRQTISSWERDRSEPDIMMLNQIADLFHVDMNELLNGIAKKQINSKSLRYIFYLTTLFQIAFSILLIILHGDKSIGGVVLLFVFLAINITMYGIIGYMIKNDDYGLLAGYNEDIEYNDKELERMLQRMRMSSVYATLLWTILLCILYLANLQQLWPLLCVVYTFEFLGKILLENYRSRKKIFKNEKDILASKRAYPSLLIFIFLLFAWLVVMIALMEFKAIENNTKEAGVLAMFLIGFMIINIIYLCYAQWYARKETYNKNKEVVFSVIVVVINVLCMMLYSIFIGGLSI